MTRSNAGKHPRSLRLFGAVAAIGVTACAVVPPIAADEPDFVSVQPDLFGVAGSLSNAWADFDGDGDLDFAVSIKGGEVTLYRNDDGTFTSVGAELGLPVSGDELRGLSWGDYDGDGDLDLLGGSNVFPIPSRSYVFRNDGDAFTEVATEIGLSIPGRFARQSNWVDYDNDGDLDLYSANRTGMNWLFRNTDGAFERLGFGVGPADPRRTVGACWFDMDQDGDLDLFLTNQNGDSDAMWRNDGDSFVDVAPELGMDQTLRTLRDGGVGCAIGDYNNDGFLDLYVAVYGPNLLYQSNGDGTFSEVAEALGVTDPHSTVGAAWADYDLDGDLDLMSVGYERVDGVQVPLNLLYRNDGDGFVSVIGKDHVINAGDHGIEWIDYDEDGDVDLSLTDGYGPEGGHFLFNNQAADLDTLNGLNVLVVDAAGHFTQAGAEVRVYQPDGALLGTRMVTTGGGYNTQSAIPVHFGLGELTVVDVEVTFMGADGRESVWSRSVDAEALSGGLMTIRRPGD
ncbi:MAG: CRTAC1 family protein [Pseudomonadota bacterium]